MHKNGRCESKLIPQLFLPPKSHGKASANASFLPSAHSLHLRQMQSTNTRKETSFIQLESNQTASGLASKMGREVFSANTNHIDYANTFSFRKALKNIYLEYIEPLLCCWISVSLFSSASCTCEDTGGVFLANGWWERWPSYPLSSHQPLYIPEKISPILAIIPFPLNLCGKHGKIFLFQVLSPGLHSSIYDLCEL